MLTLIYRSNNKKSFKLHGLIIACLCLAFILVIQITQQKAHAFTPNYNPSNLIDNPTLLNNSTMSAGKIQIFLSNVGSGLANYSDVESCGSSIAPYYSHPGPTRGAA